MADEDRAVLIAEDDPFIAKVLSNRLKEEGFLVKVANEGKSALDLLRANRFALVLLDLLMPVVDGYELLRNLRKYNIHVPVLVYTNLSEEYDLKRAIELGAEDCHVKTDTSMDDIVKAVKVHLYGKMV